MKMLRSARLVLVALLLSLIPATSHAGVLISVAVAPPVLPVYDQPPCPQPGWMWTPGYWAYDYNSNGYYWVPGTWVPAPYEGALWTPGYWGWSANLYVWHPGYWGRHVGYYGGVNYGFGFFGIGFVGGLWRGHDFVYNTAVVHVNETVIRNVYVDRTVIVNHTVVNNSHVAYAGGPGGINHPPTAEERLAEHDQHIEATSYQTRHIAAAQQNRASYFATNHGRPAIPAAARPMTPPSRPAQPATSTRGTNQPTTPRNSYQSGNSAQQSSTRPGSTPPPSRPATTTSPAHNPPAQEPRPAEKPRGAEHESRDR